MENKEIDKLHNGEGVTYVTGLGFITCQNSKEILREIKKYSNIICLCLLTYFFLQNILVMPATYLTYYLGMEITINQVTGMILKSTSAELMINFIVCAVSLTITFLLLSLFFSKEFNVLDFLRKPHNGSFKVAMPIVITTSIIGEIIAILFMESSKLLGLVFSPISIIKTFDNSKITLLALIFTLITIAIEEFVFRGAILFSLRKFGDEFAIIISSLLFALFQKGIVEIISSFLLGLALSYFVVRTGSIYTALASRGVTIALLYGFSFISKYCETSLALVIDVLILLVLFAIAGLSFVWFCRNDKNAFVLKKPNISLSLRTKIVTFNTTIGIILLIFIVILHVILSVQIIG